MSSAGSQLGYASPASPRSCSPTVCAASRAPGGKRSDETLSNTGAIPIFGGGDLLIGAPPGRAAEAPGHQSGAPREPASAARAPGRGRYAVAGLRRRHVRRDAAQSLRRERAPGGLRRYVRRSATSDDRGPTGLAARQRRVGESRAEYVAAQRQLRAEIGRKPADANLYEQLADV